RGKDRTVPTCHSASRGRALTLCVVKSSLKVVRWGASRASNLAELLSSGLGAEQDRPPVQPGVTLTAERHETLGDLGGDSRRGARAWGRPPGARADRATPGHRRLSDRNGRPPVRPLRGAGPPDG